MGIKGEALRDTSIAFVAISPLFVIARFVCRLANHGLGSDDWTIVLGLVFTNVLNIMHIVAVDHGFGLNPDNFSKEDGEVMLKAFWLAQVFYKLGISAIKASICLLYLRIFTDKKLRIITWATLAAVVGWGIGSSIANIFQCNPLEASWTPELQKDPDTWCASTEAVWYSSGIVALVTDAVLLTLPVPLVYKMQRPLKEKLLLYMIFGIGIFVTATTIVKMTTVDIQATDQGLTRFLDASLWSMIEANVGIVCACLPTLRAFMSRFVPALMSWRGSSFSRSNGGESDKFDGKRKWSSGTRTQQGDAESEEAIIGSNSIIKRTDISTTVDDDGFIRLKEMSPKSEQTVQPKS